MVQLRLVTVCGGCGTDRALTEFSWKDRLRGLRASRCKYCQRAYARQWYASNRERHRMAAQVARRARHKANVRLVELAKYRPCADCGRAFAPEQMDFDHVRGEKVAEVSSLLWNATPTRVAEEIAKCDVVCANCHRIRTRRRLR